MVSSEDSGSNSSGKSVFWVNLAELVAAADDDVIGVAD